VRRARGRARARGAGPLRDPRPHERGQARRGRSRARRSRRRGRGRRRPGRRRRAARARRAPPRCTARSRSCEPACTWKPASAPAAATSRASRSGGVGRTPNLLSSAPVAMCGWVRGSRRGFTRTTKRVPVGEPVARARRPGALAVEADEVRAAPRCASRRSAVVLGGPPISTRAAGTPARSERASSPTVIASTPTPSAARWASTAPAGFALTAKRRSTPGKAARSARPRGRRRRGRRRTAACRSGRRRGRAGWRRRRGCGVGGPCWAEPISRRLGP
jgi:hypothetical protein